MSAALPAGDGFFIGVMSGTSIDGIDAVLVRGGNRLELVRGHTRTFPAELRAELRRLCTPGENEIERLGRADVAVGREFAQTIRELLETAGVRAADVRAIGSHGQTIRHRPAGDTAFTLQIGDPNVIAAQTGIAVVADFRRKDLALGGQGAPLVPAFHDALFRKNGCERVILNLGGIANLTVLPGEEQSPVRGFDTGPGNTLLDAWCRRVKGEPMDRAGALAARGAVIAALLERMLADPYFAQHAPKSTGPEYFSLAWLDECLVAFAGVSDAEVQATLVALTAQSAAAAIADATNGRAVEIFVCGGGVHNPVLLGALRNRLQNSTVATTAALGVDPGWVEAMAFAWLAQQRVLQRPGNCPAVTGATRPAVLGGMWLPM
ncbi:MAG: anhydro-N-acetylmuramic acid kinase [Candidatus Didemnitutus sp.]|nr:anhydro-N-acetylmuramic acid kinase [Candidatus Didemnitutus sp.]